METTDEVLLDARARVLADLAATGSANAGTVDVVENALAERRWWADEWPEGAAYVAGQIAQDVQDALFDNGTGRWPLCRLCAADTEDTGGNDEHELRISPDLGPDPVWLCEKTGAVAARLGSLGG